MPGWDQIDAYICIPTSSWSDCGLKKMIMASNSKIICPSTIQTVKNINYYSLTRYQNSGQKNDLYIWWWPSWGFQCSLLVQDLNTILGWDNMLCIGCFVANLFSCSQMYLLPSHKYVMLLRHLLSISRLNVLFGLGVKPSLSAINA